jgi:hypothetical protein
MDKQDTIICESLSSAAGEVNFSRFITLTNEQSHKAIATGAHLMS